jgi:hypothetical protein
MANDHEQAVRRRAYEIWERDGRAGRAEDHWMEAERELAAEAGTKNASSGAPETSEPSRRSEAAPINKAARKSGGKESGTQDVPSIPASPQPATKRTRPASAKSASDEVAPAGRGAGKAEAKSPSKGTSKSKAG